MFDKRKVLRVLLGEARILGVSLMAGVVCLGVLVTAVYASHVQGNIAGSIVRLHVIANSDTEQDQVRKLQVRDAILGYLEQNLNDSANKAESLELLEGALPQLETIAQGVLGHENARASLGKGFFPAMAYGPLRIPSGVYTALRVYIGEAEGSNWWCVMFPPLCFVDEATAEATTEGLERFASVMPENAYELVSGYTNDVQLRFAIVDWWNGLGNTAD